MKRLKALRKLFDTVTEGTTLLNDALKSKHLTRGQKDKLKAAIQHGSTVAVSLSEMIHSVCPACEGTGKIQSLLASRDCTNCEGSGVR